MAYGLYRPKKSPFWHYDFRIHGYRFPGSTEERSKAAATAVAKEKYTNAKRFLDEAKKAGRGAMTIGTAIDRWWEEVGSHGAETDLEKLLAWLKTELKPKTPMHTIGNAEITRVINARRKHVIKSGRDSEGKQLYRRIGPRTVNRTVPLLLKRVFRRAVKNWDVLILKMPDWTEHLLTAPKRKVREITLSEEAAIEETEFADFGKPRRLSTILGLRLGEVLLTWPQVDFENAVIRIIAKGGIPRIIPLNREAYELLWSCKGQDPFYVFTFIAKKTRRCAKSGRDFVRGSRYPITYYGLSTHRRRKFKKAGVDARYHDTRHTAGMRNLRATGNLKHVQGLLGHSDIKTTADFYTDALLEDLRAGLEATSTDIKSRKDSRTALTSADKALKG